jgi:hypothetical protein
MRFQGPFRQIDAGATFNYKWLLVGEYVRGIPGLSTSNTLTQDVLSTMVGYTDNDLTIGYSYDINFNALSQVGNANHEISIVYTWPLFIPRPKKEYTPLPCPKF